MTKQSLQPSIHQRERAQSILKQRLLTARIDIAEIEFYMISHQQNVLCCTRIDLEDAVELLLLFSVCGELNQEKENNLKLN